MTSPKSSLWDKIENFNVVAGILSLLVTQVQSLYSAQINQYFSLAVFVICVFIFFYGSIYKLIHWSASQPLILKRIAVIFSLILTVLIILPTNIGQSLFPRLFPTVTSKNQVGSTLSEPDSSSSPSTRLETPKTETSSVASPKEPQTLLVLPVNISAQENIYAELYLREEERENKVTGELEIYHKVGTNFNFSKEFDISNFKMLETELYIDKIAPEPLEDITLNFYLTDIYKKYNYYDYKPKSEMVSLKIDLKSFKSNRGESIDLKNVKRITIELITKSPTGNLKIESLKLL